MSFEVFSRKNFVTESSPPDRMPLASLTDMPLMALSSSGLASTTAASAARFMLVCSASKSFCLPISFAAFSIFCRLEGSGIFTSGLPRKPSALPRLATAVSAPFSSAALTPAEASLCVSDDRFSAAAGMLTSRPVVPSASEAATSAPAVRPRRPVDDFLSILRFPPVNPVNLALRPGKVPAGPCRPYPVPAPCQPGTFPNPCRPRHAPACRPEPESYQPPAPSGTHRPCHDHGARPSGNRPSTTVIPCIDDRPAIQIVAIVGIPRHSLACACNPAAGTMQSGACPAPASA